VHHGQEVDLVRLLGEVRDGNHDLLADVFAVEGYEHAHRAIPFAAAAPSLQRPQATLPDVRINLWRHEYPIHDGEDCRKCG
jgi:hypothetical protein